MSFLAGFCNPYRLARQLFAQRRPDVCWPWRLCQLLRRWRRANGAAPRRLFTSPIASRPGQSAGAMGGRPFVYFSTPQPRLRANGWKCPACLCARNSCMR